MVFLKVGGVCNGPNWRLATAWPGVTRSAAVSG